MNILSKWVFASSFIRNLCVTRSHLSRPVFQMQCRLRSTTNGWAWAGFDGWRCMVWSCMLQRCGDSKNWLLSSKCPMWFCGWLQNMGQSKVFSHLISTSLWVELSSFDLFCSNAWLCIPCSLLTVPCVQFVFVFDYVSFVVIGNVILY